MLSLIYLSLATSFLSSITAELKTDSRTTYVCREKRCVTKITLEGLETLTNVTEFQSMESCRLLCGKYGNLWPLPTSSPQLGNKLVLINPSNIDISVDGSQEVKTYLENAFGIFVDNLVLECRGDPINQSDTQVHIVIKVQDNDVTMDMKTIESYELNITLNSGTQSSYISVNIIGNTVFGARHALETVSQLTSRVHQHNSSCETYMIDSASVTDKPIFKHRGLLIDTSRHYIPVEDLERTIRAMAANKLNVLHWHATDTHSFPLVLSRVPSLARLGAYSAEEVYTEKDITHLVDYAKKRGVRILMEIDSPAHTGNGWQFGEEEGLGSLVLCRNFNPWQYGCLQPPCGQLNPANPNVYKVLGEIYKNLQDLMSTEDLFHMGGDEVFLPCWNMSAEVRNYMNKKNYSVGTEGYMELWAEFHNRSLSAWDTAIGHSNTKIILWTSDLTDPKTINNTLDKNRYIIEAWTRKHDRTPEELLNLGYEVIYASVDAWYLDQGFNGVTQYHYWRTVYDNKITIHPRVLGGEAALWTEYADSNNLDNRFWPRAAALAERLWSAPSTSSNAATYRLLETRERLIRRGVQVDQIVPQWCYLNEGLC